MKRLISIILLCALILTACVPTASDAAIDPSSKSTVSSDATSSTTSLGGSSSPPSSSTSSDTSSFVYTSSQLLPYTPSPDGFVEPESYNISPLKADLSNEAFFYMSLELEFAKSLLKEDAIVGYKRSYGSLIDNIIVLSNGIHLLFTRESLRGRRYIGQVWIEFYDEKDATQTATMLGIGYGATRDEIVAKLGKPDLEPRGSVGYLVRPCFFETDIIDYPAFVNFYIDQETNVVKSAYFASAD